MRICKLRLHWTLIERRGSWGDQIWWVIHLFKPVASERWKIFIPHSNVEAELPQHFDPYVWRCGAMFRAWIWWKEQPRLLSLINNKGMKRFHQNVRGLFGNLGHVSKLLHSFPGIDILSLSETHVEAGLEQEKAIYDLPGYTFVNRPRNHGKGGGVGTYIRWCKMGSEAWFGKR